MHEDGARKALRRLIAGGDVVGRKRVHVQPCGAPSGVNDTGGRRVAPSAKIASPLGRVGGAPMSSYTRPRPGTARSGYVHVYRSNPFEPVQP